MPKTKFQDFIFTLLMVIFMVYAMVVYNIAGDKGGLTLQCFHLALFELPIMVPVGFILEFFIVGNLSKMIVFRHMTFEDKPIFITFFITGVTIAMMCPLMSAVATILFKGVTASTFFTTWIALVAHNMPMAFFWQFMYCGPFVRLIFKRIILPIMEHGKTEEASEVDAAA